MHPYTIQRDILAANHNCATCLGEDTHGTMMCHSDANHNASCSHQSFSASTFKAEDTHKHKKIHRERGRKKNKM